MADLLAVTTGQLRFASLKFVVFVVELLLLFAIQEAPCGSRGVHTLETSYQLAQLSASAKHVMFLFTQLDHRAYFLFEQLN